MGSVVGRGADRHTGTDTLADALVPFLVQLSADGGAGEAAQRDLDAVTLQARRGLPQDRGGRKARQLETAVRHDPFVQTVQGFGRHPAGSGGL